ncbi:MAG TPA: SPFH domain-containing protein [Thermomicrobiales bacterium]|nr:SPFH domain-containing protein [Thermomicrobiales bacterium]
MDAIFSAWIIGPIVLLFLIFAAAQIYIRDYIKVPLNQVAVFTGRGTPKVVRGGARFRVPGLERVDTMSLEPFNLNIQLAGALSRGGVPINVEAVGLVRIGSTDEAIMTAVERFLTADAQSLQLQINEILAGSLRGTVATMSVEELNGDREAMARAVIDEVSADLSRIGMEVDVLKIQNISDEHGYLQALGQQRIAEVKRDAAIGTAEAERDATIRSAQARQQGSVAEAAADTAIAEAEQNRDVAKANYQAKVEAERARTAQAGPLADAQAQKAVGIAIEEAEAARVEARTIVETKRATEVKARLQADVVEPAEAERTAVTTRAEGESAATVLVAKAQAERIRQEGDAAAAARIAAAKAFLEEQVAQADGLKANLMAEAAGKEQIAEAFNQFSPDALRLQTLPDILAAFESAVASASAQVGSIDRISIIGGAGDASAGIGSVLDATPLTIAKVLETLAASGIDLPAMLKQSNTYPVPPQPNPTADPAPDSAPTPEPIDPSALI